MTGALHHRAGLSRVLLPRLTTERENLQRANAACLSPVALHLSPSSLSLVLPNITATLSFPVEPPPFLYEGLVAAGCAWVISDVVLLSPPPRCLFRFLAHPFLKDPGTYEHDIPSIAFLYTQRTVALFPRLVILRTPPRAGSDLLCYPAAVSRAQVIRRI